MHLISVVVPVYNESEVIGTFYERATRALAAIEGFDHDLVIGIDVS